MYDLAPDDETMALNRRYGFNNTVAVLKGTDFPGFSVVLVLHVSLKYFPRMRAERTYSVEVVSPDTRATGLDRYRFTSKSEASKYFTQLTKQLKRA